MSRKHVHDDIRDRVLAIALEEGFPLARIAPASAMEDARRAALDRHGNGFLDGMGWITPDWLARSSDPGRFLEGARSVLIVALGYGSTGTAGPGDGTTRGREAGYAHGRDYHRIFEKKLRRIARRIRDELHAQARPTVDYGPLLERPLAALAGLGWLGKSTMLLVPGFGPWVLLGAVATTLELAVGAPLRKSCGSCRRCIVACPTGALSGDGGAVDARLCISYHTIENRGSIPRELRAKFGNWVFGCDACLDACPVGLPGRDAHPQLLPASPDDAFPPLEALLALDEAAFRAQFQGRPIMRAKRDGFLRNVCVALGNTGSSADIAPITRALADQSPLVRGHAAWAVGHLCKRGVMPAAFARSRLEERLAIEHDEYVREEVHAALADVKENADGDR